MFSAPAGVQRNNGDEQHNPVEPEQQASSVWWSTGSPVLLGADESAAPKSWSWNEGGGRDAAGPTPKSVSWSEGCWGGGGDGSIEGAGASSMTTRDGLSLRSAATRMSDSAFIQSSPMVLKVVTVV